MIKVNTNSEAYGSLERYSNTYGNSDGRISGGDTYYLDRVLAHEMTHAVMWINIDGFNDLPQFITEGMAELTHGIDDDRKSRIEYLAKHPQDLYDSLNLFNTGTGTSSSAGVKNGLLTVSKDFDADMLDLTSYSTDVKNVDATALSNGILIIGNDKLYGEAVNDSIDGGKGNDTLAGGTGTDTLTGASVSGSNVILTIGDYDLITVVGGKDKNLTIMDENGNETTKKYPDTVDSVKTETFDNNSAANVTLASDTGIGNATARTKTISIVGNKLNNTILGGSNKNTLRGGEGNDSVIGGKAADKLYGDAGADTLAGGAGNDKLTGGAGNDLLWGGNGADKFIYVAGDGKDIIYGFDDTDMLEIAERSRLITLSRRVRFPSKSAQRTMLSCSRLHGDDFTATTRRIESAVQL